MSLFEQAKALGRAGRPQDGVALIERAAEQGDPEGSLILAHWHLYGNDRPRNPAAAYRLLEDAARKGSTQAARTQANLTANGTGTEADRDKALQILQQIAGVDAAAAAQLEMLPRLMTLDEAKDAKRERLSSDPSIEIVRKLLLPHECQYLMRSAEPSLRPSLIFDAATGQGKPDPIRTSHGASFLPHDEDLVIQEINRRIALATGTDVHQAEALYVMRYTPGQEYKPHLDALAGLRQQRAWTAITYLNNDYEGGATVFPELSITIAGEAGDVLIFSNLTSDGQADFRMRHSGLPVTAGVKWIATRWIRQGPHDPYDRG
jgi:prolyl 4-hydroxylase